MGLFCFITFRVLDNIYKDVESWHVGTHLQPQHFRTVGRSSGVQSPSWLQIEFKISLDYARSCLKNKTKVTEIKTKVE